jgi:hypothetical protein
MARGTEKQSTPRKEGLKWKKRAKHAQKKTARANSNMAACYQ